MNESSLKALSAEIRKEFYSLRNGIISETLRKGGLNQKYIFGLQLPQIKEVAEKFRPDSNDDAAALARALWKDRECREGRLLACHLIPPDLVNKEEAELWASDVTTREEADIIAFRMLRHLTFAIEIADKLSVLGTPLAKYTSEAILRFF